MKALTKKSLRDLRRHRAQVIAVGVTIMLGVALFIAAAGAYRNLSVSYQQTYQTLDFADLAASGGEPAEVAGAARAAGAEQVAVRTQADLPMLIDDVRLIGRIAGLSEINDVRVVAGALGEGALVEQHAAQTFDLHPGDTVSVFSAGAWQELTVEAVVVSPEYLWPARSRQEVLSDPHSFAVVFLPEAMAAELADDTQVLATVADDVDVARVAAAMRAAGATDVAPRSDQPSHAALTEDLQAFGDMAIAFPLLFLTAAAMTAYVMLSRKVRLERPTIGTFLASGARRGRVIRHYMQQGLLVGSAGSVVGAAVGWLVTGMITSSYTEALGIPDTVVRFHPDLVLGGLLLGPVVGLLGAAAPAIAAARTHPAAAMRVQGETSWTRGGFRRLPVAWRMALRAALRSPRRTLATMLGTTLALILVLASIGMMTSLTNALRVQFDQVQREDAVVVGERPEHPGITEAEPAVITQVTAASAGESYATTLYGLAPDTTMHGFWAPDGQQRELAVGEVLAGAALADRLDVAPGERILIDGVGLTLAGFVDEPLGTVLYTDLATARDLVPATPDTWLIRFDPDVSRDAARTQISNQDGVLAYQDADAFVRTVEQYLGFFWVFVGVAVALGGVLALAVIQVTMAVNLAERTNEIATFRAAGAPVRRVAGALALENLLVTWLALPLGLAAGVVTAGWFIGSFNSDLFQIDLVLPWWVLVVAAAGVLLAAGLSQVPAARVVRRVDVARVVRERSAT